MKKKRKNCTVVFQLIKNSFCVSRRKRKVNEMQRRSPKKRNRNIEKKSKSKNVGTRGTDSCEIRRIHFIPRDPIPGLALLILTIGRDNAQEVQKCPECLTIGRG